MDDFNNIVLTNYSSLGRDGRRGPAQGCPLGVTYPGERAPRVAVSLNRYPSPTRVRRVVATPTTPLHTASRAALAPLVAPHSSKPSLRDA
eukprot:2541888-Pleurochrysis_carterae.AAC.1